MTDIHNPPEGQLWCPECEGFLDIEEFNKNPNQKRRQGKERMCRSCWSLMLLRRRLKDRDAPELLNELQKTIAKLAVLQELLKEVHGIDLDD